VSKEHARIVFQDGKYLVEDLDSKHSTFVNKHKIDKASLRSGDEITIGDTVLRFEEIDFS